MTIEEIILDKIKREGSARVKDVAVQTGKSRAYIHRFFQRLVKEGVLVRVGETNLAVYVHKGAITPQEKVFRIFKNTNLQEEKIFAIFKQEATCIQALPENTYRIFAYASTEMLNNAIEHSGSKTIAVTVEKKGQDIEFIVNDVGIGIFEHIKQKKRCSSYEDVIGYLLKGKQTTDPTRHTGEGIFFTSKIADYFTLEANGLKLIINWDERDISTGKGRKTKGTKVFFRIERKTKKKISELFKKYSNEDFTFDTTEIYVRLFHHGVQFISRSEAKRLLDGLEKFQRIILDFSGVEFIGQGFADEIFRVWQEAHPDKEIIVHHAEGDVLFMIERAKRTKNI